MDQSIEQMKREAAGVPIKQSHRVLICEAYIGCDCGSFDYEYFQDEDLQPYFDFECPVCGYRCHVFPPAAEEIDDVTPFGECE